MSAPASDTVVVVSPNPVGSASGDESINEKTGISVDETVATRTTAVRT
jgi:hypothetical protein